MINKRWIASDEAGIVRNPLDEEWDEKDPPNKMLPFDETIPEAAPLMATPPTVTDEDATRSDMDRFFSEANRQDAVNRFEDRSRALIPGQVVSGLGQSLSNAALGKSGTDTSYFERQRDVARQETVGEFDRKKKERLDQYLRNKLLEKGKREDVAWQRSEAMIGAMNDPNSTVSQAWQAAVSQVLPGKDVSRYTAAQLQAVMPGLSNAAKVRFDQMKLLLEQQMKGADLQIKQAELGIKKDANEVSRENAEANRDLAKSNQELRKDQIDYTRGKDSIDRSDRKSRELKSEVEDLGKDLLGVADSRNSLLEVERVLGSPVEAFSVDSKGVLSRNGKPVNLPGASVPGAGRVAIGSAARELESAMAKLFNTTLKDRSGATVANSELERLRVEFGEGRFNTEADMVKALQRFKRILAKEIQQRSARFSPEAQREAGTRGIVPKVSSGEPVPEKVMMISPDGKRGRVPKAQMEQALKQGFKVVE